MIDKATERLSRIILSDFGITVITMIGISVYIELFGINNIVAGYLTYLLVKDTAWNYDNLTGEKK